MVLHNKNCECRCGSDSSVGSGGDGSQRCCVQKSTFVKYLATILLSSAVSALMVLFLLGRLDKGKDDGKIECHEESSYKSDAEVGSHKERHSIEHDNPGWITDYTKSEHKLDYSRRGAKTEQSPFVDGAGDSNSRMILKSFYVTRKRYSENQSTTAESVGVDHGDSAIVMPAVPASDPYNPQPGLVACAYAIEGLMDADSLQRSTDELPEMVENEVFVDTSETFSPGSVKGAEAKVMRWHGFIKCKRAMTCTFLLNKGDADDWGNGYSMRINNDLTGTGCGQNAMDADLKVGWNTVEIVCQFKDKAPLTISFRPKGSLSDPRTIAPKDLFHDEKPEEDW